MTVLELKKEIDDYIEAGGDKYCDVFVDGIDWGWCRIREVFFDIRDDEGGLVIR